MHCGFGMVFAINSPSGSFDAFEAAAVSIARQPGSRLLVSGRFSPSEGKTLRNVNLGSGSRLVKRKPNWDVLIAVLVVCVAGAMVATAIVCGYMRK